MDPSPSEPPDRLTLLLGRVYLLLCIAFLVLLVIHSVPEHQRQAVRLRLLRWSHLATSRIARRAGAGSMRRELATGEQLYAVPFRLSLLRDRIGEAYERESAP